MPLPTQNCPHKKTKFIVLRLKIGTKKKEAQQVTMHISHWAISG